MNLELLIELERYQFRIVDSVEWLAYFVWRFCVESKELFVDGNVPFYLITTGC